MSVAQILQDDDVERPAEGLGRSKAKDALGTAVPELNVAFCIGIDDGVGRLSENYVIKSVNIESHCHASR